eukprot:scaffold197856_cov19-Prasinocladus_malaysianus.AAC.1
MALGRMTSSERWRQCLILPRQEHVKVVPLVLINTAAPPSPLMVKQASSDTKCRDVLQSQAVDPSALPICRRPRQHRNVLKRTDLDESSTLMKYYSTETTHRLTLHIQAGKLVP